MAWWNIARRVAQGVASGRRPGGPRIPGSGRAVRMAERESPAVQRLQQILDAARDPSPANIVRVAQRDVRQQRNVFTQARARQQAEQVYMPGQRSPTEGPWGVAARDVTPRRQPQGLSLSQQAAPRPGPYSTAPVAGYDQRLARRQRRFEKAEAARKANFAGHDYARYLREQEIDAANEELFPTPKSSVTQALKAAAPASGAIVGTNVQTVTAPEGRSARASDTQTKCKPRPRDHRSRGGNSKRWVPWCDI